MRRCRLERSLEMGMIELVLSKVIESTVSLMFSDSVTY